MKRKERLTVWIFLVLLAVGIVCLPLFRPGFFVSDDGGWMIIRLSAFYQSFREGQFPVRFLGRLNNSYGYPVANFLYPGFMYIGSFIHALGFSFVDTIKIILGGSILTGSLFTFLWLKKYFSPMASFIGAIGFTTAPYVLFDLYHRGSVGEVLALAWAAMGLYSIAAKKPWLFGLAVPLLILSHNTLALLFLAFFAAYITFLRLWREFWFMFAVGVGMSAFFWLPAIYERKYVVFDRTLVATANEFFVTISNMGLVGLSGLIGATVSLTIFKPLRREKVFFFTFLLASLFMALPVSQVVWKLPIFTSIIQFPYRFLSLAVFASVWLMAYALSFAKRNVPPFLFCFFVGAAIFNTYGALRRVVPTHEPEGYYTTNEGTTNVADEYMPKWVSRKPAGRASERLLFYDGGGTIVENRVTTQTIDVTIRAAQDSVVQVNTVYYPGWGATVDGTKARLDYTNMEGLMRIPVPAGEHHLIIAFRETISRFLADMVSLGSIAAYIFIRVLNLKKSRKK